MRKMIKQIFSWGDFLYYLAPLMLAVVMGMDYRENKAHLRAIRLTNQQQQQQIDRISRWVSILEKDLVKQDFDRQAAAQQISLPIGKGK